MTAGHHPTPRTRARWKDLRDYVLISSGIVCLIVLFFVLGGTWNFFNKWIGLLFFTFTIFGVMNQPPFSQYTKRHWRVQAVALVLHLTGWSFILLRASEWKFIWFYPAVFETLIVPAIERGVRSNYPYLKQ